MRFMQLKHDPNAVVRKKLIKSGKKWAVVSALSFAGVLLGGTLTGLDVNADVVGTSDISNPDSVVNTGTEKKQSKSVTANVTINSNLGEETVNNVTGEVGQTVTITVPAKEGYRADKSMIVATVNADGTITTDESVNYTSVETENNEVAKPEIASEPLEGNSNSSTISDVSASQMNTQSVAQKAATTSDINSEADNLDDGGKFGYSSWYIDNGGTLHIGAGKLGSYGVTNWKSSTHFSDINSVQIDAGAIANANSESLFSGLSNVTSIDGIGNLDTSNVTNMYSMFSGASKIQSLDLSNWNTSNATDMHYMFNGMSSLEDLNLSSFNTENVTDMGSMFIADFSLKKLDLSSFDTSKVTTMSGMFSGPDLSRPGSMKLEEIIINPDKFNTSNVTNMASMFYRLPELKSIDTSKFNTSKVTSIRTMFNSDSSLKSLDLSSFDTRSLAGQNEQVNSMLYGTKLYKIKFGAYTGVDTSIALTPGNWQAVGSGTENDPQGEKLTADQIMERYSSTMPSVAETYVRLVNGTTSVDTSYSDNSKEPSTITSGNIQGVPGNNFTTTVVVPAVEGYTPYKNENEKLVKDYSGNYSTTVSGTIDEPNTFITKDSIIYKPDVVITSVIARVLNESGQFMGQYTIPDISEEVNNYDVSELLPNYKGYTPKSTTVNITKNDEGGFSATDIFYKKDNEEVSADVTIKSNLGDQTVKDVPGTPGKPLKVKVPIIAGYTSDKSEVDATVNAGGTITVNDPKNAGYVTYTKIPTSNGGGGLSTPTPTEEISNVYIDVATFADQPAARLYDSNGQLITNRALKPNTGWYADKKLTKNGISYYRVASNEWVKMNYVYVYNSNNKFIETYNDSSKHLLNAHQKQISRELRPTSDWVTDISTYMNGVKYYRVGSNEFVSTNDAFEYIPLRAVVQTNNYNVTVYDERGNAVTNRQLKANSSWLTDKSAVINGVTMYRVATNEWVRAIDVLNVKE
ncbi:BspA family leucine-rich repeat surface protein [Companilactobacillus insicii]|uniref:BspA family leucine-rich repeat surface protein n=1 Tax=Companilactobacillus insicii TaxID=1732567 RepID=UPI000F7AE8DE|nr:BspA family leucine-rich repeat surface protein [Companilactobacillus insicii]